MESDVFMLIFFKYSSKRKVTAYISLPPSSKMKKVKNFRKICWEGLENVDFGGSNLEEEKKEGGNFADHEELRTFEKVIQNCILEV